MLVGAGLILIFQSVQTYVVDAFTLHAASGSFKSFALSYLIFFFLQRLLRYRVSDLWRALAFPSLRLPCLLRLGTGGGVLCWQVWRS